jgi:hypothetical protein
MASPVVDGDGATSCISGTEGEQRIDLRRNGAKRSVQRGTSGGRTSVQLRLRRGGSSGMRGGGRAVQQRGSRKKRRVGKEEVLT